MKILYLPFAFLYGLSNIRDAYAAEPEASCQDDHKYTYLDNDEIALTCGEIREFDETRQELCVLEEVKVHCPFSCGICCEDTESYIINCDWIAEQGWRKVEYCGQTFEHRMVQEMCPIACDYCMDHIDGTETLSPTTSTRSPTSHPVEDPTTPAPHGSTKAPSKTPSIVQVPSSSKAASPHQTPSSKVPTPLEQLM